MVNREGAGWLRESPARWRLALFGK